MARRSQASIKTEIANHIARHGSFHDAYAGTCNYHPSAAPGTDVAKAAKSFAAESNGEYVAEVKQYRETGLPLYKHGKHVAWGASQNVREILVRKAD